MEPAARRWLRPGNNLGDDQRCVALRPGTTGLLHLEAKEAARQPMALASRRPTRPVARHATPRELAFRRRPARPPHLHQDPCGQA